MLKLTQIKETQVQEIRKNVKIIGKIAKKGEVRQ